MSGQYRWSKPQREQAKAKGKGLYGFAASGPRIGYMGHGGLMDEEMAVALFYFIYRVYRGVSPIEAFAQTEWPGAKTADATEAAP